MALFTGIFVTAPLVLRILFKPSYGKPILQSYRYTGARNKFPIRPTKFSSISLPASGLFLIPGIVLSARVVAVSDCVPTRS